MKHPRFGDIKYKICPLFSYSLHIFLAYTYTSIYFKFISYKSEISLRDAFRTATLRGATPMVKGEITYDTKGKSCKVLLPPCFIPSVCVSSLFHVRGAEKTSAKDTPVHPRSKLLQQASSLLKIRFTNR